MFLRIGVFYVLAWFFLLLLAMVQQATGLLPLEIGLAQWGPGVAALLMLVICRKDGHKIVFFSKDVPFQKYLLAVLIPLGVGLIIYLIRLILPIQSSTTLAAFNSLPLMILWMPFGAIGEELGWRGYLQKKLDTRMRGIFSSLLVGILWAPIHVTFLAKGPLFVFFLFLLIISYAVVIYALVQDIGFNVLVAAIFHLMINLTNLLYLDVIYQTTFMMVNSMIWVIVAVVVIYRNRRVFLASKTSDNISTSYIENNTPS
jgi:membrane protease YdiL (CAAX protease family)